MSKRCLLKIIIILVIILGNFTDLYSQKFCQIKDGYAYFEKNPKTNGIDFKVRIPQKWKVEDGSRPHIVAKIEKDDLSTFMIIISNGSTFISRNTAKQIYADGCIEQSIYEEFSSRYAYVNLIDAYDVYINSYPTRKSVFRCVKDIPFGSKTIQLECVDTVWTIFCEDNVIQFMAACPKKDYDEISFIFNDIAHSIVFFDYYDQ
jgi:hypothetical protein